MCTYFKTETDVDQDLVNDFLSNFDSQGTFPYEGFKEKKKWGTGLISEKTEVLYAQLNEGLEAVTSSYSATCNFL